MDVPASWLFVKGNESIWIVRPHGFSMIVSGPGAAGARHDFDNDDDLQKFQIEIAETLTNGGWLLWGVGRHRRGGAERRAGSRGGTDRRRTLSAAVPAAQTR